MIDIQQITKSFGQLQVLKGIDLHIAEGEMVSIVGPSGAGKTTLLQIMGNFYAEYIMRNAVLGEAQAGIKIAGRNINL